MIFSGSFKAGLSFVLTGAPAVGTEVKSVSFAKSVTLAQGTAANQGQVGWGNVVVVPAGQTYSIDLQSVDASALGYAGRVAFTRVRGVYVENQEPVAAREVLLGITGGNDATGYAARIKGGGHMQWGDPLDGVLITSGNRYLTLTNTGAASVAVGIALYGTGTLQDT